jgi:hypothetical protein
MSDKKPNGFYGAIGMWALLITALVMWLLKMF